MVSPEPQNEPELRRVAVMIKLDYALPHHVQVFDGIQQYAARIGCWRVVLDPFAHQRLSENRAQYSGVIGRATPALFKQATCCRVPVVNIWFNSPVMRRLPGVFPNGQTVGQKAAEHLLHRGLTRFGLLHSPRDRISNLSAKGFRQRLAVEGFKCLDCNVPQGLFDAPDAWRKARQSIGNWIGQLRRPLGVFAARDQLANTLADLCASEYDINIPRELALIGAGNERAYCENPWMTLSSIDMNFRQVGWEAAELLDRMINGADPPDGPLWVEPSDLVPRQSTDVIAVDDADVSAALRFIAESSERPIQVQDVADAVATARRTLQRRFRETLGRSITQYIEDLRLARLKRLLINSDEPVKSLATRCGFNSFHHLYRTFVRVEGMPPNQYRKQRRAGR